MISRKFTSVRRYIRVRIWWGRYGGLYVYVYVYLYCFFCFCFFWRFSMSIILFNWLYLFFGLEGIVRSQWRPRVLKFGWFLSYFDAFSLLFLIVLYVFCKEIDINVNRFVIPTQINEKERGKKSVSCSKMIIWIQEKKRKK